MLLRNLFKVLISVSTAVLVAHVTTTPETRLRLIGQVERCLLLASSKVPKLSEHISRNYEIQPRPSYNAQLHSRAFLVSEIPANFKQLAKRLRILFKMALYSRNPQWNTVELLGKAVKNSLKLQNDADQISLWWAITGSSLRPRVFKALSSRMRHMGKSCSCSCNNVPIPWGLARTTMLREESITVLEFSLPLFTLLLHYLWRVISPLCSPSRYPFLRIPITLSSSNTVTDEITSAEQVAEANNEDSPQSSAPVSTSVSIPLTEPLAPQCFSQTLLAGDVERSVTNVDRVIAEPLVPRQSSVPSTVLAGPEPFTHDIESLFIDETTIPPFDAAPLRRKKTFPNSRLKQQQREAFADLTQFVVRKNSENRTPSFV